MEGASSDCLFLLPLSSASPSDELSSCWYSEVITNKKSHHSTSMLSTLMQSDDSNIIKTSHWVKASGSKIDGGWEEEGVISGTRNVWCYLALPMLQVLLNEILSISTLTIYIPTWHLNAKTGESPLKRQPLAQLSLACLCLGLR